MNPFLLNYRTVDDIIYVAKNTTTITNPDETSINCLISFDNKATWKAFTGTSWTTISDITPNNILLNGMSMKKINNFTKEVLVQGGFTGNIDFRIALKTNDDTKTPSITKIYIEYKKDN